MVIEWDVDVEKSAMVVESAIVKEKFKKSGFCHKTCLIKNSKPQVFFFQFIS